MIRSSWLLFGLALFLFVAGCSKTPPATATTVRGYVTFQGRPLAGGLIVFAPDREKGNPAKPLSATIASDGGFQLTVAGPVGVPAGWYRIALADPPGVFTEDAGFPRFPGALRRPDKSGLEREVIAGKDNVLTFEVDVP